MGRRSRESGHTAKQRRSTIRPKVRKAAAGVADLRQQLNRRTLELEDAVQQQMATGEVLSIIRQSPADAQPVFDAIVQSASRLCGALFGVVYLCDGDRLRIAATNNFTPSAATHLNELQQLKRPERSHLGGRAVLDRKIVHVTDVLEDPEYSHELALAGGWRAVLAVPLLRDGIPLGALTAAKAEAAPFSDRQIQLFKTFADQAIIAIENVRLFESVEARTRELATSLENLRTTQDRLVQTQKLASLGQLTAGIAHEMKNPLNFVNNFSGVSAELVDELREILKEASFNETRRGEITELMDTLRSNLDKVVEHGKRADGIVKNMLLHSHQGSGEHRPVAINSLIEESLKLAYHGARAEKQNFNIMVDQSLDPAAGEVDIFPQEITRVLLNLISNGVYATRDKAASDGENYKPTLSASTKSLGDRVEIRIRDNGIGIPSEVKDKIFNPFFTTKPAGEGTGLGLSISHDIIVKQHGGSIEVDTKPGEFTEVRVVLPRAAVTLAERV